MKNSNNNTKSRKALKAAWTNWKAGRHTSWSTCLKSAWKWVLSLKDTATVFADEMYKFTEKAVCVNYKWFPLSQVTCNFSEVIPGVESLESIEIPMWLYRKSF